MWVGGMDMTSQGLSCEAEVQSQLEEESGYVS